MSGQYHMVTKPETAPEISEAFDVTIPSFSLDSPHQGGRVH
jgi:uncharacterized protein affecting Mg2+/Co2+ transport